MNLNSKYFDRIRINPDRAETETTADAQPCEWHGCGRLGGYRAPKGRDREGQYYNLCIDHVREYNKSYNYFAGMKDDDIVAYQRSASIGHRPTWTMGVNAEGVEAARMHPNQAWASAFADPYGYSAAAASGGPAARRASRRRRPSGARCGTSSGGRSRRSTLTAARAAWRSRPVTRRW